MRMRIQRQHTVHRSGALCRSWPNCTRFVRPASPAAASTPMQRLVAKPSPPRPLTSAIRPARPTYLVIPTPSAVHSVLATRCVFCMRHRCVCTELACRRRPCQRACVAHLARKLRSVQSRQRQSAPQSIAHRVLAQPVGSTSASASVHANGGTSGVQLIRTTSADRILTDSAPVAVQASSAKQPIALVRPPAKRPPPMALGRGLRRDACLHVLQQFGLAHVGMSPFWSTPITASVSALPASVHSGVPPTDDRCVLDAIGALPLLPRMLQEVSLSRHMPCSERIGPSQAGASVVLRSALHSMAWAIACALRLGSDFMLRCWCRCSHTSTSKSQPTRSRACLAFSTFTSTRGSWPRRLVAVPERTRPIQRHAAHVLTTLSLSGDSLVPPSCGRYGKALQCTGTW